MNCDKSTADNPVTIRHVSTGTRHINSGNPFARLAAGVINKIAAGEVIERPASVVKELLENCGRCRRDRRSKLSIENGGIDLIRVTDNGCGIPAIELDLAVTSHATSKIRDADELFRVGTFGFRGKHWLPSREVSQLLIRSRTEDPDCGYELVVQRGNLGTPGRLRDARAARPSKSVICFSILPYDANSCGHRKPNAVTSSKPSPASRWPILRST